MSLATVAVLLAVVTSSTAMPTVTSPSCHDELLTSAHHLLCGYLPNVCEADPLLAHVMCPHLCDHCGVYEDWVKLLQADKGSCEDRADPEICNHYLANNNYTCPDHSLVRLMCPKTCAHHNFKCADHVSMSVTCAELPNVCEDAKGAILLCPKFCRVCGANEEVTDDCGDLDPSDPGTCRDKAYLDCQPWLCSSPVAHAACPRTCFDCVKPTTIPTSPPTSPTSPTSPTTSQTSPTTSQTSPTTSQTSPTTSQTSPTTSPTSPTTSPTSPTTSPTSPTTSQTSPTTSQTSPTTSPTSPTTSPTSPTTSQTSPTTSQTSPTTSPTSPTTSQTSPTTSQTSPTTSPTSPRTSQTSPTTSQTSPTTSPTSPTTSQTSPTTSQTSPTTSQTSPTTSQTSPTTSQTSPTTSQTSPTTSQTSPTTSQTSPTTSQTSPTTSQTSPTTSQTSPTTSQTSPTTSQTSPTTSQTSPTTSQTSPTTSQTSPTTSQTTSTTASGGGGSRPGKECVVCGDAGANKPCSDEDLLFAPTTHCPDSAPFCMNDIYQLNLDVRQFKRCVDQDTCYKLWYRGSSDKPQCTKFNPYANAAEQLTCHLCCYGDSCNLDDVPPYNTQYRP